MSGLKQVDRSALQSMMDKTVKELLIPGAVILLRTPQGEFTITSGTTLLGATLPPRVDTYFRIASNTKTMTSAVIQQLAQENKLSLDDSISKYVEGVPNCGNITIAWRMHHSGPVNRAMEDVRVISISVLRRG